MKTIWTHASKAHPCPICGKEDWCTFGDRAMLCQRVESPKPHSKGGWFHFYDGPKPRYVPATRPAPKGIDASKMIQDFRSKQSRSIEWLASDLHVSIESLRSLDVAWSQQYKAWAFPMSDHDGKQVGIRLRADNGFKWAVEGSRGGIFLPNVTTCNAMLETKIAFLPEGPTDTAAGLSMGLLTIGRSNNNSGGDIIKLALKRLGIYKAVVIADNDEMKYKKIKCERCRGTGGSPTATEDGSPCDVCNGLGYIEDKSTGFLPGIDGAMKLKKEIGVPSVIWMPPSPIKDLREFYKKGGTSKDILSAIKNKIWSRK